MTTEQRQALDMLTARGANAIKVPGGKWVWKHDIRESPAVARDVLRMFNTPGRSLKVDDEEKAREFRGNGLPAQPPPMSERGLWQDVRDVAHELERGLTTPKAAARSLYDLAMVALSQLGRGIHENPDLAIVSLGANPPGRAFASDVLAIVYQHEDDRAGDVRVHTFGGQREAHWKTTRGGRGVEIFDFPSATGVYMYAIGDKRVVMQHRRGLPLVQEF